MMTLARASLAGFSAVLSLVTSTQLAWAQGTQDIRTIEDYNASLIKNGIAWKAASDAYNPSFYTGFAPRVEDANRVHLHLSRGNQMRLTAPLDEMTVLTYVYGLKKRADVYTSMIQSKAIVPVNHRLIDGYMSILASDAYGMLPLLKDFDRGQMSREIFYEKSLAVLKALNPGRVFDIRIDFAKRALAWRDADLRSLADEARKAGASDVSGVKSYLSKNTKAAIVAANNLLLGRINAFYMSDAQTAKLAELTAAQLGDNDFVLKTTAFFTDITASRYEFRTITGGQFRKALSCASAQACDLVYPELTAIYPNGSIRASVSDRQGNTIPMIRENGVMHFVERAYHDVDHIRTEPFYGFIPKMDYTMTGNGLHNPAVRTYLPSAKYRSLRDALDIPKTDDTLWIVSRGEVSHGCTRMAAGHVEEVRQIFPSNPREMTKLYYTGNNSADYDLFDIDGTGSLRVMGVDYLIAYAIVSDSGAGYREGNGLITASFDKAKFYDYLYGKGQYTFDGSQYVFQNPYISYFTGLPSDQRAKAFSVEFQGNYPLYEQAYEKDKLQFYVMPAYQTSTLSGDGNNKSNAGAQVVRLMGRITGCGPFAKEFSKCYESGFEAEMSKLLARMK